MGFDLKKAAAAGKALGPHPALMDRSVPVSIISPGTGREGALLSQSEAKRHLEAFGGDQAIDFVADCIELYSDPVSTAPFRLEAKDGNKLVQVKRKGTPPDHNLGPTDLYALLEKPNPYMLYDELMSLLVIDLLLVGNAYWLKWRPNAEGKPLALYRLSPAFMKIRPGDFGPKKYEYQIPGMRDPLKIDPINMIHFRRPNPHSAYYGMGVIQAAGRSMDLELAIVDTMASYYENRADPSLIIESERRVPRDVMTKLRAQIRARVSGTRKAGELLILEAGLKASPLTTSARDALFAELSKMSRDRIFTKFRASPMLFGIMDETSGTNKVSDARREFDNYALRPFLTRLERQITAALTDAWDTKFIFDYRTLLPADEASKIAGEIAKAPGIKVREVRRQYAQFGIDESTGDPDIDEFVLNMPGPEMDADGMIVDPVTGKRVPGQSVGAADRPLPGEAGRPPKGENTSGFGVAGKALTISEIEAELTKLGAGKAINPAGERVTVGNKLPDERRPSDPFSTARKLDVDGVMNQISVGLRDASTQLERDLLDQLEGKALKTSDIVSRIRQSNAWTTFKSRITEVLEDGARAAAASAVMHSGRTLEDEIDYDDIAKSIVHRPEGVRSILNTIRDRVVKRIKEARESDGERADYQAAIQSSIAEWSDSQAVTIADSEATEAYNEATLTVLEMTGSTEVYVTDGEDHDEPCQEANGQVWDIPYARQHRKEHPRCRRAFLAIDAVA